jgi:hypothetical protein
MLQSVQIPKPVDGDYQKLYEELSSTNREKTHDK